MRYAKRKERTTINKAIFLDRDGVVNPLVYNPKTSEYESPYEIVDFAVYPFVEKALRLLRGKDYRIVLVSNQPSFAKGKTSLENINRIENALREFSDERGGLIDKYCYCHHHPNGVIPEYTFVCKCRKPKTLFLEQMASELSLNPKECWFIGDCDSDVECGQRFGCRTVKINNPRSVNKSGKTQPDLYVENMYEAAVKIIKMEANNVKFKNR